MNNETILSVKECEDKSLVKGKLTIIIETYTRSLDRFMQAIFSLLANSSGDFLHHIIVCINGPDVRTGEIELQDAKERFVSELRDLKWHGKDMPVTLIRVWSRVGRGHSLQMAMPWVHTEYYAIVDDILLTRDFQWENEAQQAMESGVDFFSMRPFDSSVIGVCNGVQLHLPRIETSFLVCRKDVTVENNINWLSYFIHGRNFKIDDEFLDYCGKTTVLNNEINKNTEYHHLVVETGAWLKNIIYEKGLKFQIGNCYTQQLIDTSWFTEAKMIKKLEDKIAKHPGFGDLYKKYKVKIKKLDFTNMEVKTDLKILVGVIVYKRKNTISAWLRAWQNAEKYGAKIAVVHNYDGDRPPEDQKENIMQYKPDYYLPRPNVGWDLGAFQDMLTETRVDFPWDVIVWFTDDCLPMRKDFLKPFVYKISEPGMGLVGQCSEGSYMRTNAFAVKKEVMKKIEYVEGGGAGEEPNCSKILNREHCLRFENRFAKQVENLGYKVDYTADSRPNTANYVHWSVYCSEWLWDWGGFGDWNLWDKYENQFDNMKINVINPPLDLPTISFIVVYDRVENLERWLRVWEKSDAGKLSNLAVLHNFSKNSDNVKDISDLVKKYPVNYYIERDKNLGRDIGAFQDVILSKFSNINMGGYGNISHLDNVGWFTDDFIPMTDKFIEPFLDKIKNPKVGIVGACFEPHSITNCFDHIRTVGFMIKSEVAKNLKFPECPLLTRHAAFEFEHGSENMTKQIMSMGYEIALAIGPNYPLEGYSHWVNNQDTFMFDASVYPDLVCRFDNKFGGVKIA